MFLRVYSLSNLVFPAILTGSKDSLFRHRIAQFCGFGNHRQPILFAKSVAHKSDLCNLTFAAVVLFARFKGDGVDDDVVVNVIFISMGIHGHLMIRRNLHGQLTANFVGQLRRYSIVDVKGLNDRMGLYLIVLVMGYADALHLRLGVVYVAIYAITHFSAFLRVVNTSTA